MSEGAPARPPDPGGPRRRTRRWVHAALAAAAPLVAAELGLRLVDVARGKDVRARASWHWLFEQDRLLGYRPRPGVRLDFGDSVTETNALGFRDREWPAPGASTGRPRIICMGESSTWGLGSTSREATWPRRLEEHLRAAGSTAEVLNAGVAGYSLLENVPLLRLRLVEQRPDAILYMGLRNDVDGYVVRVGPGRHASALPRALAPLPSDPLTSLLLRSSLVGLVLGRVGAAHPLDPAAAPVDAAPGAASSLGLDLLGDQVAELALLCARHGIRLVWVHQPLDRARLSPAFLEALGAARARLDRELAAADVPALDAERLYDARRFPLLDDCHLSDEGNRHLAALIGDRVGPHLERR